MEIGGLYMAVAPERGPVGGYLHRGRRELGRKEIAKVFKLQRKIPRLLQ
jgi:hypothetical protein